ncbi:hypothetical protein BDB00DRAFT_877388 [Zychaea mexicana]|uniref:uncharacterized protein n=1 Tax=Zychaea mexicana TaxID=64656 RepID=UPI0022FEC99A|nr:uncharacterized protein BDB00DRAFT_877388 [Zychaea mexicana]KAI9488506.1 hypothetical protein BDB00DRAFT_877388 [Zychaea mexicana]
MTRLLHTSSTPIDRSDPLKQLNSDVLEQVFSQFTQSDIIECMLVCRLWREQALTLSFKPWQDLQLNGKKERRLPRRPPPFSNYIRTVLFDCYTNTMWDNYRFYRQLRTVIESWGCQNISTLVFTRCHSGVEQHFINLLKKLTNSLRVLIFDEQPSNLPFLAILAACPNLRTLHFQLQFEYHYSMYVEDPISAPLLAKEEKKNTTITFDNLTCMSLDYVLNTNQINNILRRCPNLRCVRYGSNTICRWQFTDLSSIIKHCPRVEYIECNRLDKGDDRIDDNLNGTFYTEQSSKWKQYKDKDNSWFLRRALSGKHDGLRVFKYVGTKSRLDDFGDIVNVLKYSQDSLETLQLANCQLEALLSKGSRNNIQMRNLRKLVIGNDICTSTSELCAFISHCTMLTHIQLDATLEVLTAPAFVRVLKRLPALTTLGFRLPYESFWSQQIRQDRITTSLLQALGSHFSGNNDDSCCSIANLTFGTATQGFPISNAILDAISSFGVLRSIELHNNGEYLSESQSLDKFTDMLLKKNTLLQRMWLRNFALSIYAFVYLGRLVTLQELRLTQCSTIYQKALEMLIKHKNCRYHSIPLYLINSLQGILAADAHLIFALIQFQVSPMLKRIRYL